MVPTRRQTPYVPLTTDEILEDVRRCAELGVSIVHVHARDEDGVPSHRADHFAPIVEGIREIDPRRMASRGIRPELEAFEVGMVAFGRHLVAEGLLPQPCYVNLLLGGPGTAPFDMSTLAAFLGQVPDDWTWALAGIGRHQLSASLTAVALGGQVRVGIEDNVWWDRKREVHATNEMLVRRVAEAAELAQRPLANPAWTRERLGLASRPVAARPLGARA